MLLYITDSKKTKHAVRVEGIESITFTNNPAIITFNYLNGSKKELHMVEQDFKVPSDAYVVDKLWAWVDSGLSGKSKQLTSFLGGKAKVDFVRVSETNLDHSENKTYLRISKFHDSFVEKKVIPVDDVTGVLADGVDSIVITTKGKDHRIVLVYEYNNIYSSDANSEKSATNIITNQLSEVISKAKKNSVSTYNPIEFISFEYEDENLAAIVSTVAADVAADTDQVSTVNTKKLHDISLYGFDIWDTCSLDMPFNSIQKTLTSSGVRVFEDNIYDEYHTIRNFVLNVDNYGSTSSFIGKLRVMSNKLKTIFSEPNYFPFVADDIYAYPYASPSFRSYDTSTNPMPDNNITVVQQNFKDSSGNFGSNTTFADVHPHSAYSTAPYFSFDYYTNQNLKGTNKYTGSWSPVHTSIFYDSNVFDGTESSASFFPTVTALHNTSLGLDKSVRFNWIDIQTGSQNIALAMPDRNLDNLPGHYMLCKEDGVYKVRISLSHIAQAFYRVEDPNFNNGNPAWIAGALNAKTPEQDFNMYVACNTYSATIHDPTNPNQIIDPEGESTSVRQLSEKAKEILSNNGADEEDYVFIQHANMTTASKILVHRNIMGPFKAMPNTGTISGYAEFIIPAKKNQTYFELDFVFQNNTHYSGDNDNIGGEAKVVINVDKLKNDSDNEVFKGIWNRYRAVSLKGIEDTRLGLSDINEFTGLTVEDSRLGNEIVQGHHPLADYLYHPYSGGTNTGAFSYDTKSFETTLSEINPGAAYNLSYMSIEKISDLELTITDASAGAVLSDNVETVRGVVPLKGVERIIETEETASEYTASGYTASGYTASGYYYSGDGIGTGNL